MTMLSRLLRRLLALALLLAVPAGLYLGGVAPVRAYYESLVAKAGTLEDTLARYRKLGAERPQLAVALRHAEAREPDTALYLEGASDALAAARLQERLNTIVKDSGGSIDSVRVLESAPDGPYRRVSVELLIESRIDALRTILYRIETGKPSLFIKSVNITTITGIRLGRPMTEPADLDVRLEVYGFRKGVTS